MARFTSMTRLDIEVLIRDAETKGAQRWVLFLERGPRQPTLIHDGVLTSAVIQPTRPELPYLGYFFSYDEDEPPCDLESDLLREVASLGSYNVVARQAGLQPVSEAIAPAFWN